MLYKPYFAGHGVYLEKRVFKEYFKRGIDNIVISANYDNLPQHEINDGVDVYRVTIDKNNRKWLLIFTIKAIKLLYKLRMKYSIIHIHGIWDVYGLFTIFSKILHKKTLIHMTLLGSDDPLAIMNSYKFMKYRMRLLSKIDGFIAISSPMSDSYKKTILPLEKLHQIPQGVDTNSFLPVASKEQKARNRELLGLPVNEKIVIFVGAIMKRKGVDFLIDAWKIVNERIKDAKLILVGPDTFDGFDTDVAPYIEFCEEMKNTVEQNHLDVLFIGMSDKVPLYLKSSDLFVLPSRREGFGNVVIEAMSSGLPVIITEMDKIAYDLIEDGKQGYIVNNKDDIAEKIITLLEDNDLLVRMGKSARDRAVNIFDISKICDEYIQVYSTILNE